MAGQESSKELDGLAEVLGIFKDVRLMKVEGKEDYLANMSTTKVG